MLDDTQKLNAIVWAAKQQEVSYGVFSATLTEEKYRQIYKDYENYLEGQQKIKKMANKQRTKKQN